MAYAGNTSRFRTICKLIFQRSSIPPHLSASLKSRFRYSNQIVYNNFPWPADVPESKLAKVTELAQHVLDARIECGDGRHGYLPVRKKSAACSLVDLYDPISMPPPLAKAHADLHRAVDRCYRKEVFLTDRQRVDSFSAFTRR